MQGLGVRALGGFGAGFWQGGSMGVKFWGSGECFLGVLGRILRGSGGLGGIWAQFWGA